MDLEGKHAWICMVINGVDKQLRKPFLLHIDDMKKKHNRLGYVNYGIRGHDLMYAWAFVVGALGKWKRYSTAVSCHHVYMQFHRSPCGLIIQAGVGAPSMGYHRIL